MTSRGLGGSLWGEIPRNETSCPSPSERASPSKNCRSSTRSQNCTVSWPKFRIEMLLHKDFGKNSKISFKNNGPSYEQQIKIWDKEKEKKRLQIFREQREAQDMLEKYWPWNKPIKSRGIGNLRLEEIFPDDEMRQSKRRVGLLNLGKPGGGAPNANEFGNKLIRTREDPILRFQWGKDLRRTVDNTIRYRKGKREQEEYKQQLDKIVDEKKRLEEQDRKKGLQQELSSFIKTPPWGKPGPGGVIWRRPKDIGLNFLKSMGWSDTHTLDKLENEHNAYQNKIGKKQGRSKAMYYTSKENNKNFINIKPYRLSPLVESKGTERDLVNVIARKRYQPMFPLATTDVTKNKEDEECFTKLKNENEIYLRELGRQMHYKIKKKEELKLEEMKSIQCHFATWDSFWGRPGHGAPRSVTKKGHIERMLFPQIIPIGVA